MFWKRLREFSRSISFRLNLWHTVIYGSLSVLLVGLIYLLLGAAVDRNDRDAIEARLLEYVAVYQDGGADALSDWVRRINQARRDRMFFVRLVAPDGRVLLREMPAEWIERDVKFLDVAGGNEFEPWIRLPRNEESDLTVASTRLEDGTLMQVGRSSESRARLVAKFRQVFVVVIPPVALLGFIGGALLTRRMTRPVRKLVEAASHIVETGRMDVRVPARRTEDELQELVVLFNRMLDSNEHLVRMLRESLDNVAHDLRTPLSRLRATLETSARVRDSADYQEGIGDALEETERVETIIRALMDVSQAQAGVMQLRLERTDLSRLVRDVVELYEPIAQEKGIEVTAAIEDVPEVQTDPPRMRQVFANLLDNAIKYTPTGGAVQIHATSASGAARVVFRDTGPGIAAQDLPRIWERLYRADKSRSEHGLGLGLSLVKAIVEAHGGRVEVDSAEGEGAEFRVFLAAA